MDLDPQKPHKLEAVAYVCNLNNPKPEERQRKENPWNLIEQLAWYSQKQTAREPILNKVEGKDHKYTWWHLHSYTNLSLRGSVCLMVKFHDSYFHLLDWRKIYIGL